MLFSLALIFSVGLCAAALCSALRLPRLVGMLLGGMVLGPYGLALLDPSILSISGELRQIALIIILLKAGLSLDLRDLKRVGRPAVLMAFVPASFELLAFWLFAPALLGVTPLDAAIMGAVLSAVSPAVVVPRMVHLMENGYGTDKSIPQMILAGASCDDIFVLVLFSTLIGIAQGQDASLARLADVPLSIVLGAAIGGAAGWLLSRWFTTARTHGRELSDTIVGLVVLSVSFLLVTLEARSKGVVAISGMLAVVSMACVLARVSPVCVTAPLRGKLSTLWSAAELLLFGLVGAAVDLRYAAQAGGAAVGMLALALLVRACGVLLCLLKTPLNAKERWFCVLAYLPKATVQAAIGSVPLTLGMPCGTMVLCVAVLGILCTAPLGACAIDRGAPRLLTHASPKT